MDAQRIEDITEWDARNFSDGFAGLRRLADEGFSGAVTDGSGWLFLLNGRVVGVVDGELDDFADASGTAYDAPHAALPLLFAMQEQGGEPRAQYYTNDTPLSEADRKLSSGGFTGYVELSENVLSGDYYVAYYGGDSLSAAYVGNSRRLETGEEAFDLANDEVGIYTVYEVDLDVHEIPDASGGAATATSTGAGSEAASDATESTEAEPADSDAASDEAVDEPADDVVDREPAADERATEPEPDAATESAGSAGVGGEEPTAATATEAESVDDAGAPAENGATDEGAPSPTTIEPPEEDAATGESVRETRSAEAGREPTDDGRARDAAAAKSASGEDVFSEEAEWREAKSIPALDPSETDDEAGKRRQAKKQRARRQQATQRGSPQQSASQEPSSTEDAATEPSATETAAERKDAVSQRPAVKQNELQRQVQRLESALEEAEAERDSLAAERDELARERDEHREERERLETELAELREELDRVRSELSQARSQLPDGERSISPREALAETNLFVRYESKGGATLEKAHDGKVDREALRSNLRIEYHTSFDAEGVLVDGQPFEEYLHGTMEYGFTKWLVEDFPFEVRETGNESTLRDLYDAIPEVDRAEIGGEVSIATRENGEEHREQRAFDLVLRDRMGNPLFVADLNDSRDPTAEGTLESLVANGGDIAESSDSFAAAFAVTASFFEPGALETASDAVGGGLFSRSKRKSFVKLSRKRGYHLCLVESRDGGFHLTVPDL